MGLPGFIRINNIYYIVVCCFGMMDGARSMKIVKDLVKLLALLALLAIVFFFIHDKSKTIDREKRYSHPISRPGSSW